MARKRKQSKPKSLRDLLVRFERWYRLYEHAMDKAMGDRVSYWLSRFPDWSELHPVVTPRSDRPVPYSTPLRHEHPKRQRSGAHGHRRRNRSEGPTGP